MSSNSVCNHTRDKKIGIPLRGRPILAPSTLTRFQTKTELFCSGYGYRPHYNAENDHRKRSHSKTLSRVEPSSSPEESIKNRDLWSWPLAWSNTGSPRFTDFPSLCASLESSLTNLIGSGLNLLCLQSHSNPRCRWTRPEVMILGADQKERGLWEREWSGAI